MAELGLDASTIEPSGDCNALLQAACSNARFSATPPADMHAHTFSTLQGMACIDVIMIRYARLASRRVKGGSRRNQKHTEHLNLSEILLPEIVADSHMWSW